MGIRSCDYGGQSMTLVVSRRLWFWRDPAWRTCFAIGWHVRSNPMGPLDQSKSYIGSCTHKDQGNGDSGEELKGDTDAPSRSTSGSTNGTRGASETVIMLEKQQKAESMPRLSVTAVITPKQRMSIQRLHVPELWEKRAHCTGLPDHTTTAWATTMASRETASRHALYGG